MRKLNVKPQMTALMLAATAAFVFVGAPVYDARDGGAFAKNGNAGGNGNGNGNAGVAESASASGASAGGKVGADGLTASQRGNMNGALNSSDRAKEAQIANGNYLSGKGPVSLAAALAVADYQAAGITADDIANAEAVLNFDQAAAEQALQDLLDDGGVYTDKAELQAAVDDGTETDAGLIAALETTEPPTQQEIDDAQATIDAIAAVASAEKAITESWNKNTDTNPDSLSTEEQGLLDGLRSAMAGVDAALASASVSIEGALQSLGDGQAPSK